MTAYFRLQCALLVAVCFFAGLGAGALYVSSSLAVAPLPVRVAVSVALAFAGAVVGRVAAGFWSARRLAGITATLYRDAKPRLFLERFEKLAAGLPDDNIARVDAQTKLAFAHEALGDFAAAHGCLDEARRTAGLLKMHALHAGAMIDTSRARLLLLRGDADGAQACMESLRSREEVARVRARSLAAGLDACLRLYGNWLSLLRGEDFDLGYIEEEFRLAGNPVYKAEMRLLLGMAYDRLGRSDEAREVWLAAEGAGEDLYAVGESLRLGRGRLA